MSTIQHSDELLSTLADRSDVDKRIFMLILEKQTVPARILQIISCSPRALTAREIARVLRSEGYVDVTRETANHFLYGAVLSDLLIGVDGCWRIR